MTPSHRVNWIYDKYDVKMGEDETQSSQFNDSKRRSSSSRLSVTIAPTTPSSVTTGELFTIEGTISFESDFDGNPESATVTVEFSTDSDVIKTIDITLSEGNSKTRSATYALTTTGSHPVTVSASATIDGSTHTGSASQSIDASSAESKLNQVHGAGFSVPDSMRDEVNNYRDTYYLDLPYAFVLARPSELYIVFCATKPEPSEAVVSGPVLANSKTISVVSGVTFKVVAATDTSFITTGDSATVQDVDSSPSSYALELVRITDHHERVSTLYDPDSGNNVTVMSTLGLLKETSTSKALTEPGGKSRDLTRNVREAVGDLRKKLQTFIAGDTPSLTTFNLDHNYWSAANATVDALVLPSGSTAREFLASFDKPEITAPSNGEPVLYVIQTTHSTSTYTSVSDLKNNASDGDLVEITGDYWFAAISAQETIEHSTGCGEDKAQVNDVCVNLVQDVHVEAGVMWTNIPDSKDDVLSVAGLSSTHLDEPYKIKNGEYSFVGEVVSTARFDPSLPDAKILIIYDSTREADIDYSSLKASARDVIESRGSELIGAVQHQLQGIWNDFVESWSVATGSRLQHTHVAFDSGYTYLSGLGSTVRAIDTENGTVEWTYDRGGSLVDSGPAIDNGVVVLGGGDGRVYGLDPSGLTELWTYSTGHAVVSSPTIVGGVVYVGNNGGEVYALDRDDGSLLWKTSLGSAVLSDPVIAGTKVYVTTDDGRLVALGVDAGRVRWDANLEDTFETASPILTSSSVFAAGTKLHSFSKTGTANWSKALDGSTETAPSYWNGVVYVGTDNGRIHAFNASEGTELWTTSVNASGRTTVFVQNKVLFVTNTDTLYLFDALAGNLLTFSPVGGTAYASPAISNGSAYLPADDTLLRLDLEKG